MVHVRAQYRRVTVHFPAQARSLYGQLHSGNQIEPSSEAFSRKLYLWYTVKNLQSLFGDFDFYTRVGRFFTGRKIHDLNSTFRRRCCWA
ncbi:hypothetical protein R1flu_020207 [Riccia fluitans]|uniref:Uncharacterized protein n=1 Tax=Riccia fluitans TaxID=41844 RepID=A0ABD1ZKU9_9MARC